MHHLHHLTASSEFCSFSTIPLPFFLTSQRTRTSHTCHIFLSLLILLSGDIQSNPGPVSHVSSLNMCSRNIRSFPNRLHYTADLADTHNIDVFALTETWISPNTTSAQLFDAIPPLLIHLILFLIHAFLCRWWRHSISSPWTLQTSLYTYCTFKSFKLYSVTIKLPHSNLVLYNICRPPQSTSRSWHSVSFSQFLEH